MIAKIRGRTLSAAIDSFGAELTSLYDEENADELIWQRDPAVWAGSAPILFPVIGRMSNGGYCWRNKPWKMPLHGLVRKQEWLIEEQAPDHVVFRTTSGEFTGRFYPGEYTFDASVRVAGRGLQVSYQITNTGGEEMLFSLGSHPGISLPMGGTCLEDYFVEFNRQENCALHRLTPAGLLAARPEKILNGRVCFPLTKDLFQNDALFLLNIESDEINVRNRLTGRSVTVQTGGAPDLGIWSRPGAAYVCVEPWFGHDDFETHDGILEHKAGMIELPPGESFSCGYGISARHCNPTRGRRWL